MKNKTLYIIFLAIVSLSCFCAALVAPILAKFVSEEDAPFNGDLELDYTVSNVFTVESQEDLFAAISEGYSYIQLSKDIENPLIITQSAKDLNDDLILDLNGIEIQRNGYEPILNIGPNIRLTVTDTSTEQTGGLYNPVGSVFNIDGGILTVVTGNFESGPRYSEYYSYNSQILEQDNDTQRTLLDNEMQRVTFHQNTKNTDGTLASTTTTPNKLAPIISSYPKMTGNVQYVHGNLYFDEAVTRGSGSDAFTIAADTYCYYQTSENLSASTKSEMADWYYTYYVNASDYSYASETKPTTGAASDYIQITIYGYEKAINTAASIANEADYYAAIQMQSGTLSVQNGGFYCYFGVNRTACVNAQGGTIDIGKGEFSSRIPNATSANTNSITTKETDSVAFNDSYFNNFDWNNSLAKMGESYCILNGGMATVTIDQGKFYSSNNNLINMSGGTLSIGSATQSNFTKKTTIEAAGASQKTAAIHMASGNISVAKSSFDVDGNYTYGIHLLNGEITVEDGTFTIDGVSTHGILSKEGNISVENTNFTVNGTSSHGILSVSGTITLDDTNFTVKGDSSHGIRSQGGNITLATGTISIKGTNSYGVRAQGEVKITNGIITLEDSGSYGILAESGNVTFDTGSITLNSNQSCYGVYANAPVTLTNSSINVGYNSTGSRSGTVAASIGVYATDTVNMTGTDVRCYEIGLAVNGGSLNISGNGKRILTNNASAIVVAGGNLTFDEGSSYTVTSANTTSEATTNTYALILPFKTSNADDGLYNNTDGIYVSGGTFTSNGSLTLDHTGLYNDVSNYTHYNNLTITSYAIRVVGGSVSLTPYNTSKQVSITANVGGGVYCSSGNITLGNENFSGDNVNSYVTVETKGKQTSGMVHGVGSDKGQGWQVPKIQTGGPAIELNGGNITVNNGTYKAAFGDGVLAKIPYSTTTVNATIEIENGYFEGAMGGYTGYSGPASSYGVKVIGGAKVYINGGEFYGTAGGASVTGISNFTSTSSLNGNYAEVYVSAGTFAKSSNTDGFMIFDMAKVALGSYALKEGETDNQSIINTSSIVVNSDLCPISINKIGDNATASYVYVYYGTYNGGQAELWNEDTYAYVKVYNTNTTGLVRTKFEDTNTTGGYPYDTQFNFLTNYYAGISGVRGVKYNNLTTLQTFSQSMFNNPTGY